MPAKHLETVDVRSLDALLAEPRPSGWVLATTLGLGLLVATAPWWTLEAVQVAALAVVTVALAGGCWVMAPGVRMLYTVARPFGRTLEGTEVVLASGNRVEVFHARNAREVAVLVHGMGARGCADSRMRAVVAGLLAQGVTVVAPDLEEHRRFRICSASMRAVLDTLAWTTGLQGPAGDGTPMFLVGVSAGASLSLLAAGHPRFRDRVSRVVALAPVGRFDRLVERNLTGAGNAFVLGVMLRAAASDLVPEDQVTSLERAVDAVLSGPHGPCDFDPSDLPEPSRTLAMALASGDTTTLQTALASVPHDMSPYVGLSPELSAPPVCPAYLLHGSGDAIIPAAEAHSLSEHLSGTCRVVSIFPPAMGHGAPKTASALSAFRMAFFFGRALRGV